MTKRPESAEQLSPSPLLTVEINDPRALDRSLVGGKAGSLCELAQIVDVPPAFVITTDAYRLFLEDNQDLKDMVATLDDLSGDFLLEHSQAIREVIKLLPLPESLESAIASEYNRLEQQFGTSVSVAVRSSGVAEDTDGASFAGQYDTFLNQKGLDQVFTSVKDCFASQFTDRVISYRCHVGVPHGEARLAIAVQVMIEAAVSGVAFSVDPEAGSPLVAIDTSYGLGEAVVAGKVTPDSHLVDPQTTHIVHRHLGQKSLSTVYHPDGGTIDLPTTPDQRNNFALPESAIQEISRQVADIAHHYCRPMDTEFAIDHAGILWFLQARPETVNSKKDHSIITMTRLAIKPESLADATTLLETGKTGSPGVGQGRIIVAGSVEEARRLIQKGDILVTVRTDPDWEGVMNLVSAIVTDIGGPNCHAAIISREHGIPCIVGASEATQLLLKHQGLPATVDAGNNHIYAGLLPLESVGQDIDLKEILAAPSPIPLGLIISNPETARRLHALSELENHFLISLLRIEFLLSDIGVHPRALLDYDAGKITDPALRSQIEAKICGFDSGRDYYVTKLSEGIAQFAAIFPDSPITVRTTDFKTNEYSNLLGGRLYESPEANPMMGWRGLIRSLSPENRAATEMELSAIKRARDLGYPNIQIMFPVVRDPLELTGGPDLKKRGFLGIYEIMDTVGLKRGEAGLKIGIMVETPANVFRIEDFIQAGLDFISFGTNDLTQFTLAADRDGNEDIQSIPFYQEINPAVVTAVRQVIAACKRAGVKTGICGQAPSNSPDFVRMLLKAGIDSIGVMPDRYLPTYNLLRQVVAD